MSRRRTPSVRSVVINAGVQLTERERTLISNFRAADLVCKGHLINISASFARACPAVRPRPVLVFDRTKGGAV